MPKSALQELEAKLVVLEMGAGLLQKSMAEARRAGYRKNRNLGVARDTTPILGKGAVKDTYNLLGEGIEQRACRLAEVEGESGAAWAEQQGFRGYLGSSLKGEAAIEWNDQAQREQWLTAIVQDARRLLGLAEQAKGHLSRKLCFQSSCGGLEACLKHGIELMQHGADRTSRASPSAFLEVRDS